MTPSTAGTSPHEQPSRRAVLLAALAGSAGTLCTGAPATAAGPLGGPLQAEPAARVALSWADLALELARDVPGVSAPVAARAFGYVGVTAHEALAPGTRALRSLADRVDDLEPTPSSCPPWPDPSAGPYSALVAHRALAAVSVALFDEPGGLAVRRCTELARVLGPGLRRRLGAARSRQAESEARRLARAVLSRARADRGHDGHLRRIGREWVPGRTESSWVPTPPGYLPALHPGWRSVRTWVPGLVRGTRVAPPVPWSAEPATQFHREALRVVSAVDDGSEEDRATAVFWSDVPELTATPPGHWLSIASQLLHRRSAPAPVVAETLALLGIGLADSVVCSWSTKYRYDVQRPVTYVTRYVDPSWETRLPITTPPFPEYTSGHSVQSAAAAVVLAHVLGDRPFTDRTHSAAGLGTRRFGSFGAAAREAAASRVLGGIHYRWSVREGLCQGEQVGAAVSALTPEPAQATRRRD